MQRHTPRDRELLSLETDELKNKQFYIMMKCNRNLVCSFLSLWHTTNAGRSGGLSFLRRVLLANWPLLTVFCIAGGTSTSFHRFRSHVTSAATLLSSLCRPFAVMCQDRWCNNRDGSGSAENRLIRHFLDLHSRVQSTSVWRMTRTVRPPSSSTGVSAYGSRFSCTQSRVTADCWRVWNTHRLVLSVQPRLCVLSKRLSCCLSCMNVSVSPLTQ